LGILRAAQSFHKEGFTLYFLLIIIQMIGEGGMSEYQVEEYKHNPKGREYIGKRMMK